MRHLHSFQSPALAGSPRAGLGNVPASGGEGVVRRVGRGCLTAAWSHVTRATLPCRQRYRRRSGGKPIRAGPGPRCAPLSLSAGTSGPARCSHDNGTPPERHHREHPRHHPEPGPQRRRRRRTGRPTTRRTASRGWAFAGIGAGLAGIGTIVISSMVNAVYDTDIAGDPAGDPGEARRPDRRDVRLPHVHRRRRRAAGRLRGRPAPPAPGRPARLDAPDPSRWAG